MGTAPQKVGPRQKGRRNEKECKQMDNRISYFFATHGFDASELQACAVCAACAGKLWLEGAAAPPVAEAERAPKRARTGGGWSTTARTLWPSGTAGP